MKKNFKNYALLIVSVLLVLAILDSVKMSGSTEELQRENEVLEERIEILGNLSDENEKIELENRDLKKENVRLKEDVEELQAPIKYQDYVDSINAVEEFFDYITDRGNCPCTFIFNSQTYVWNHNSFVEPYEFKMEKGKFYFTYESPEYYDYEFVIGLYKGNNEQDIWEVEDIKYKEKETVD